jgi:hypothetical protein
VPDSSFATESGSFFSSIFFFLAARARLSLLLVLPFFTAAVAFFSFLSLSPSLVNELFIMMGGGRGMAFSIPRHSPDNSLTYNRFLMNFSLSPSFLFFAGGG